MRKFDRNSGKKFGRSGRKGSDRRDSDNRNSGRFNREDSARSNYGQEMHEVTCDKCGQSCEVPFKPTGGKPVYCSDCFRKENPRQESRGRGRSRRDGPRGEPRRSESTSEFQQINEKLDKILEMLKD